MIVKALGSNDGTKGNNEVEISQIESLIKNIQQSYI